MMSTKCKRDVCMSLVPVVQPVTFSPDENAKSLGMLKCLFVTINIVPAFY